MNEPTYQDYTRGVSCYLAREWPAVACAIASSDQCDRAAARATLACFMAGHTIARAAGEVAFAVNEFAR